MRFAAPQWLWALLLLPILYGYVVWELRRRRQMYARFADSAVWRVIAPELDWQARLRKGVVWLLALGMMILALARPQWGTHEESVKLNGLDLVVALDVSNSMYVEDFVPSRLKKAKHAIRNLVAQLKGDRVGLVIFAGSAYLASPLTTDIEYFLEVLETASPEAISNQGTDIGLALDTSARALERAAEDRSGAKPSEGGAAGGPATKVVLLISDGEDLEEGIGAGIEAVKKAGARFFAMGIGTEKGGPVPIRDDSGILVGFKKDEKRQPVVSRFRPAALASLTQQLAGRYWDISPNEGEVDEFLQEIGALERGEFSERTYLVYENRYQIPLFFAVLLLLLELSFRAHRRVALGFLLFLLAAGAAPAQAAPGLGVYLENEAGLKAYQQENLEEAKKHFGAAQAQSPQSPELMYNQGVIQHKSGNPKEAAMAFDQAARDARAAGRPDLAGKMYYNLGSSMEKTKDYDQAVMAYLNSIEQTKASGDKELELEARKRLEAMIQQAQQEKQQKQEQNGDSDPNKKDQQKQAGGKDDQKQDQSGDQKQDQKQAGGYQEKKRQQYQSEKLSKEDADRVMAELSNREKDLQKKMKKQDKVRQTQQKDW